MGVAVVLVVALARGVAVGLAQGPVQGMMTGLNVGLYYGLPVGVSVGLVSVLTGGLGTGPRWVSPVETVKWSLSKAVRSAPVGMIVGLAYALVIGLAVGLALWLVGSEGYVLVDDQVDLLFSLVGMVISYGVSPGVALGFAGGLVAGLNPGQVEVRTTPDQGIRRSARRAVLSGLLCGVAGVLAYVLAGGVHLSLVGVTLGVAAGLVYGGYACLSHLALRLVLWRHGAMPLRYISFLDCATERIFLRRVGGGYLVVHRLVQEHFAAMDPSKPVSERRSSVASASR